MLPFHLYRNAPYITVLSLKLSNYANMTCNNYNSKNTTIQHPYFNSHETLLLRAVPKSNRVVRPASNVKLGCKNTKKKKIMDWK